MGVATPESYMAASTECSAFSAAIAFSLGKLGLSHISLKKEQRSAILAEYQRRYVSPNRIMERVCVTSVYFS